MKYRPWIGFTVLGASIVADLLLRRIRLIFIAAMIVTIYRWCSSDAG